MRSSAACGSKATSSPSRTKSRVDDLWEAFVKHFSLRENNVTAEPRFRAMQRYPSNLISKVHFSFAGSVVTGLHCIGSMKAGSMRFRIV